MTGQLRWIALAGALGCVAALAFANIRLLGADSGAAVADLLLHDVFLPRLAASLLCGAALGLSAALLQQALQNPLAAPETLAINAGAQLALTAALLFAPALLVRSPDAVALAGAFAAWGLVAAVIWRRRSDPLTVALAGLIIGFALGAVATLATIFQQEYVTSMLIWGAGSMAQDGWDGIGRLAPRLMVGMAAAALLARPLGLLSLGDRSSAALGVSLRILRPLAIATAVLLAASAAAVAGAIGFVGLAAPHLARLTGARRLPAQLAVAPVVGALLLTMVDQSVQLLSRNGGSDIPTGAVTALLGAPLLIMLLRRMREQPFPWPAGLAPSTRPRAEAGGRTLVAIAVAALLAFGLAILIGRGPAGFAVELDLASRALDWRLPRTLGAAAAGVALGVSGTLVQRLYANPMASPESLGIGAGVGVGFIAVLLLNLGAGPTAQIAGATAGAAVVSAALFVFGGRGFSPQRLLLVGVALTALLNGATLLFLATGDPRVGLVVSWLGGSTYGIDLPLATAATVIAALSLAAALPLGRCLDAMTVGEEAALSLGISVGALRVVILGLAAVTASVAAVVIGPLSFVGLLAPRVATLVGLRSACSQLLGAAGCGALLLMCADWIGRVVFAPTELPAGLVAVLIGAAVAGCLQLRASAPTTLVRNRGRMPE